MFARFIFSVGVNTTIAVDSASSNCHITTTNTNAGNAFLYSICKSLSNYYIISVLVCATFHSLSNQTFSFAVEHMFDLQFVTIDLCPLLLPLIVSFPSPSHYCILFSCLLLLYLFFYCTSVFNLQ